MSKTKPRTNRTSRRDALVIASTVRTAGPSSRAVLLGRQKTLAQGRRRIPAVFSTDPGAIPVDLRAFNPEPAIAPARRFTGKPARVVVAQPATPPARARRAALLSPVLAFQASSGVTVCARRGIRKEVIHAKGIAGSRVAKPKLKPFSKVRC